MIMIQVRTDKKKPLYCKKKKTLEYNDDFIAIAHLVSVINILNLNSCKMYVFYICKVLNENY